MSKLFGDITFVLFPDESEERNRLARVGFAIYVVLDL